jgi:iron complex transport system ATP-binding protein
MALARRLAAQGRAVAVIVHDLNLAARNADRIALLKDGGLVACGGPWDVLTATAVADVFEQPIHVLRHPECDCPILVTALRD